MTLERTPIRLIDLGIGNFGKMETMLRRLGESVVPVRGPQDMAGADVVVLPGVGAFGDGMAGLREKGLIEPILRHAADGKPLLGVCLGMQMLGDASEEYGEHRGLGLIGGRAVRLVSDDPRRRVPNMGWCDVNPRSSELFEGTPDGEPFYFAHSYHMIGVAPQDVAATIPFGEREVVAAVRRGSVAGVQFHPELSQDAGLAVLRSFFRRSRREGAT